MLRTVRKLLTASLMLVVSDGYIDLGPTLELEASGMTVYTSCLAVPTRMQPVDCRACGAQYDIRTIVTELLVATDAGYNCSPSSFKYIGS